MSRPKPPSWIWQSIGFGCLLALCTNGSAWGISGTAGSDPGFATRGCIWVALTLGLATGLLLMRAHVSFGRPIGRPIHHRHAFLASHILIGSSILVGPALRAYPEVGPILSLAAACLGGLGASVPLLGWFERFLGTYRLSGRGPCIASISTSYLLSSCASLAMALADTGRAGSNACYLALLCCNAALLRHENRSGASLGEPLQETRSPQYRLGPYAVSVLVCFGLTCGLITALCMTTGITGSNPSGIAVSLASAATYAALIICMHGKARVSGIAVEHVSRPSQFGLFIRASIALSGVVFGSAPLLEPVFPGISVILSQTALAFQSVAMATFSIEICSERNLSLCDVLPMNYGVFVLGACIGIGIPFLYASPDNQYPWAAAAATSSFAVCIALLVVPSRNSPASALTYRELPENEGAVEKKARISEELARQYGLTSREKAVMDLLIQGKSRQEIAEELNLSVWTIKDHTCAVYSKVGVHSAKELMGLFDEGEHNRCP